MPEFMDGKNIADFIDPDIEEKLEALEREEEKLAAEGFYDSEGEMVQYLIMRLSFSLLSNSLLVRLRRRARSRRDEGIERKASRFTNHQEADEERRAATSYGGSAHVDRADRFDDQVWPRPESNPGARGGSREGAWGDAEAEEG